MGWLRIVSRGADFRHEGRFGEGVFLCYATWVCQAQAA
jgi:hypothetical protein